MTHEGKLVGCNRLCWTAVATIVAMLRPLLPAAGCSSAASGTRQSAGLFSSDSSKDEALRKRVEADKFPTAQQAGVLPHLPSTLGIRPTRTAPASLTAPVRSRDNTARCALLALWIVGTWMFCMAA